jgi:DHA2 family multidrug resistance protein
MGFSDAFAAIGFVLVIAAIAILFTRKVRAGAAAAVH